MLLGMSKKHFIALADCFRLPGHVDAAILKALLNGPYVDQDTKVRCIRNAVAAEIADFCRSQNPRFNRDRWLDYIAGECGPNGGAVRK